RADTLAELKRTLTSLRGTAPVAAAFEARHTNKARGRFFTHNLNVHSIAEAQAGDGGISVTLSRATVDRLRAQRASGPRDKDDGVEVAGDASPARVAELLDFAPTLEAMLTSSVLVSEHDAAIAATPAHLLIFKVAPERSQSKYVKVESNGDDFSL